MCKKHTGSELVFFFLSLLLKCHYSTVYRGSKGGSAYINCGKRFFFPRIVWYGVGMPSLSLQPRKWGGQLLMAEKPQNFSDFFWFFAYNPKMLHIL